MPKALFDHLILSGRRNERKEGAGPTFFERDWSLAWVNFVLQEVGSYSLERMEKFPLEKLKEYSFVYLPPSAAADLETSHSAFFKSYVESGGTLVVEGPGVNFLDFLGLKFSSGGRTFKSVSRINGDGWPQELAGLLRQMPFETRGWEVESIAEGVETVLEMDHSPCLFRSRRGEGNIIVLGFNFGFLLTGLQQGTPVGGTHRLKKLFGHQPRVIEPEDVVLKASLLNNTVPWADLFERFLFKVITGRRPTPRWWYFPAPYTGAVISTHDDEAIGFDPRLEAMQRTEESLGARATFFVISDPKLRERWRGDGHLKRLHGEQTEIGLHWNRFKKPYFKFRRFKLGMHEEPLKEQIQFLEREIGETVRVNRNHYLAMGDYYDEHFKQLAQEGIFFDSTYGPNQGGRGYLFGTGYPYYGLTWEGGNSGVLELPFLTQEMWGGADLTFLQKLISESAENFHQVVTMNFHPHYTVLQKPGRETWLGSLRFAKEKKQWIPTAGEFFEFFKTRSESSLGSQWNNGTLEIVLDTPRDDMAVSFPYRASGGKGLSRIEIDGSPQVPVRILNCWFEEAWIRLARGQSKVRAIYGN